MAEMIWGGLPTRAKDVASIIDRTSLLLLSRTPNDKLEFIEKTRARLKNLQQELLASEQAFYKLLELNESNPARALDKLQQRIIEIENQNAKFSIDRLEEQFMSDPEVFIYLDRITTESVDKALISVNWEFEDLAGLTPQEFVGRIIDEFSKRVQFRNDSGNLEGYFTDVEKKGLRRVLEIKRHTTKDNYFNISITKDEITGMPVKVSAELRQKLIKVIQRTIQSAQIDTKESFKRLIQAKLKKYLISGKSTLLTECLSYEVDNNIDEYDLTRSVSSLKGFLQEIWSNALLSCLMGGPGRTIPTGTLRATIGSSNNQIPIDTVLEGCFFQIKSYTLKNGMYESRESKKELGTFIRDRAQMDEADLLIQFFGSKQFNKPFTDPDLIKKYKEHWLTVEEYSNDWYSRFDDITKDDWQRTFNAYLDRIIRIDNTFLLDFEQRYEDESLYFNTFFLINDKLVPASVLVQCIIDSFDDQAQRNLIKFTVNSITAKDDKSMTFQQVILDEKRNKRYSGDIFKVANLNTISYEITYNFDNILQRAYNSAEAHGVPKKT